jgi:hypothetical protein
MGMLIAAVTTSMRPPGFTTTKLCAMSSSFSTSIFTFAPGFTTKRGGS